MPRATYFHQECPTCGRRLRIRVEYLGKVVACQHCHAEFEACDPDSGHYPPAESGIRLLQRANELLATTESADLSRPR